MDRREDKLFYYCAIPHNIVVPRGFVLKEFASCKYLVVEHIGSMDKIYETYNKIYKDILILHHRKRLTIGMNKAEDRKLLVSLETRKALNLERW